MGTSAARRAPTTRLWRQAKAAATRYLAPEGGGAVNAGEVAARYLAALGKGEPAPLAAFVLTRKTAQDLGAWLSRAVSTGGAAALEEAGWGDLAGASSEVTAQVVSQVLVGPDGGLEAAVARTALGLIWVQPPEPVAAAGDAGAVAERVRRFLAAACYLRLALDLGESLEAAGSNFSRLRAGLDGLREWILEAAPANAPEAPGDPEAWRGLAGWTWVTQVTEVLLARLSRNQAQLK
jgi:hypothetical protein